jgi:hypothetical protein
MGIKLKLILIEKLGGNSGVQRHWLGRSLEKLPAHLIVRRLKVKTTKNYDKTFAYL